MNKRYRLLKEVDSPDLKAEKGVIGELDNNSGKVWFGNDKNFYYNLATVLSSPKWFEEIPQAQPEPVKGQKYKSPYPDAVVYTCDKNFLVRLKALVDRSMKEAGYSTSMRNDKFSKLIDSLNEAEDYFFSSKTNIEQSKHPSTQEGQEDNAHQTYLKDCDCESGGIIIYEGKAVCRWCRTPYANGGMMNYQPEHFKKVVADAGCGWEIVAFKFDFGIVKELSDKPGYFSWSSYDPWLHRIHSTREMLTMYPSKIHSVKRLSDGVVFSVGDSICLNWYPAFSVEQPIIGFEIEGNTMFLRYKEKRDVGSLGRYEISMARINPRHSPKSTNEKASNQSPQPVLFTTEDGKEIMKGDKWYWVSNWKVWEGTSLYQMKDPSKTFSTKEAAEDFVTMNKPCLSVNDVKEIIKKESDGTYNENPDNWNFTLSHVPANIIKSLITHSKSKTNP